MVELESREDDRGYLIEIARRSDDPEPHGVVHQFGQVYIAGDPVRNTIRAFHKHIEMWDWFFVSHGSAKFVLGRVDICLIMDIWQQLHYLPNNGRRFSSSYVAVLMCMWGTKLIAAALSKVSCGSRGPVPSGDCSHLSMADGTVSTSGSPAGA